MHMHMHMHMHVHMHMCMHVHRQERPRRVHTPGRACVGVRARACGRVRAGGAQAATRPAWAVSSADPGRGESRTAAPIPSIERPYESEKM